VDNDCDGQVDEGAKSTFYQDADGDGYGNPGATTEACSAPDGYVTDNTDCDDADASVNPGATEICDGVDNDCDGQVDEGVQSTFYQDADGDGYGNPGATTEACSAPDGYVTDNTDCDDADDDVHPGATEVCNGIDDDCDGNVDEGCAPCIRLTKTINGPYRTADALIPFDLFLSDRKIPVAVQRDIDPHGPTNDNQENLFFFLVEITVENCGHIPLTGVTVQDTFSNQAQPFWTDDPGNATISPDPDPNNGMVHESLTWTVGTIPVAGSRMLRIKVGTEFNSPHAGRLEPTDYRQTIFYNGQDTSTGSASVTTNEGPSASVGAMAIAIGSQEGCDPSDGQWYRLLSQSGRHIRPHDKCARVVTPLPITLTASEPSTAPTPLQRAAPVAAVAGAVATGLGSAAWWLLRRKLLLQ
jgi:hypothetical protein